MGLVMGFKPLNPKPSSWPAEPKKPSARVSGPESFAVNGSLAP